MIAANYEETKNLRSGASAAKGKAKRRRSSDDPNFSAQMAAKKARVASAMSSFAAKVIEIDGWVLTIPVFPVTIQNSVSSLEGNSS